MEQKQINKLEMMESTNKYLDSNTSVWGSIPIVTNYKIRLSIVIDALKTAAMEQEAAQVFVGGSLQDLKVTIAEKMDILDDILEAYADDTGNAELQAQADNSKTDYIRLPHEDFETKVKHVISLLEAHVAGMADYGLNQDQIEDVKISFSTYQDKRGIPRSYQIASKQATQTIEGLMKEAEDMLDKLDKVLKRFRRSDIRFYMGYEAARTIVDN